MVINRPLDEPYIDLRRGRLRGLIHFEYIPTAETVGVIFECCRGCMDSGQPTRWLVPTHMLAYVSCPVCHSAKVEFLEFFKTVPDNAHWLWDFSTIS